MMVEKDEDGKSEDKTNAGRNIHDWIPQFCARQGTSHRNMSWITRRHENSLNEYGN
jgi:hypothetical protein